jgi:hypothetical protein
MQMQPEGGLQKLIHLLVPSVQDTGVFVKEDHVVDIAAVIPGFQAVLHILVQLVQIEIGEELAGQVADRQALSFGSIEKAFVPWDAREQRGRRAHHCSGARIVPGGLANEIQKPVFVDVALGESDDGFPIDAVEEVGDVRLEEEGGPGPVAGD